MLSRSKKGHLTEGEGYDPLSRNIEAISPMVPIPSMGISPLKHWLLFCVFSTCLSHPQVWASSIPLLGKIGNHTSGVMSYIWPTACSLRSSLQPKVLTNMGAVTFPWLTSWDPTDDAIMNSWRVWNSPLLDPSAPAHITVYGLGVPELFQTCQVEPYHILRSFPFPKGG